jgi:RNA polymerase sigma factor (sigma-70 family)
MGQALQAVVEALQLRVLARQLAHEAAHAQRAAQADEDARVLAALRRLPRRQQEVLVLRYYADASEAEIAEALGVSRGAVKSHAHRGIAALREALAGEVTR